VGTMKGREITVKEWEEMQKWENVDVSAVVLSTATTILVRRPFATGFWIFGLLLAAFAGGMPVGEDSREAYSVMLQHAEVVDSRELGRSEEELHILEDQYYNARGWFGACDENCTQAFDKVEMARAEAVRVRHRRDEALSQARQEVSIWSTVGVQDVRNSFWAAWKSGKDFAARCTMYDALFLAAGREETFASMALRLVFQYVINLTMGLVGAFFYFMYNVYTLLVSYGSSVLSGLAFFLLAIVAGISVVSTYLGVVYGAVAGGGMMLMQHAARQAAIEQGARRKALADGQRQPRKVPAPRCPV